MNSETDFRRICIFAALLPFLFGAFTLFEPFGRDQGIHATIAFALQDGLATYRDVYNIKPPMTTATHWLALEMFGHSYHAIRIFDLLYVAAGMASLAASVLLLGGGRALALGAPIGFCALFYAMGYWEHAQTDEWAALWMIFGLQATAHAWRQRGGRNRSMLMMLAGYCMGVAFCYKYTIGTVGVLVFAPLLVPRGSVRFLWRDLLWLVIGGLTCLGVVFGFLSARGVLGPFLEIQNYIRGYISYAQDVPTILARVVVMAWHASVGNVVLLGFGVVVFIMTAARRWSLLHAVTLVLAVTGMISAVAQGKAFTYHYFPAFIAMALVMGWGIEAIFNALTRTAALAQRKTLVWAGVILAVGLSAGAIAPSLRLVTLVLSGQVSSRDIAMAYDEGVDYSFADLLAFSEKFAEIRQPEETFFLWGYETGLYFLQGQPPLHRFPYSWPFTVNFHDGRYTGDLLARLESAPPDYVVIQSGDATPWVTANPDDSRDFLRKLPEINSFVTQDYEKVLEVKRYDLWKRSE